MGEVEVEGTPNFWAGLWVSLGEVSPHPTPSSLCSALSCSLNVVGLGTVRSSSSPKTWEDNVYIRPSSLPAALQKDLSDPRDYLVAQAI